MNGMVISGGTVITMDADRRVIPDGAVAILGDRIAMVGTAAEVSAAHPGLPVLDATGKAVLPGLIDGHAHAGHGLVKTIGNGDSAAWSEACRQIYTLYSPPSFWRAEAALAAMERLRFGVTTGVSLLGGGDSVMRSDDPAFAEAHCEAVAEVGTRSIVVMGATRPPFPRPYVGADGVERPVSFEQQADTITAVLERWHGRDGIRIATLMPVYRQDTHDAAEVALIEAQGRTLRDLARKHGALFHQDGHRKGSVAMAEKMFGLGGPDAWFSHCTDLTEADFESFLRTGTSVVHNPSAIAAVRGTCPAIELMEAGVNVMIGSDATAPDRSGDMFRHMFVCMRHHQKRFADETLLPPGKLLEMVTVDAAKGLGLAHEIGSLEPGKLADVITVDLRGAHMAPANMPVARVVCFANGHDVREVVIGGRVLLKGGQAPHIDPDAIIDAAEAEAAAMLARSGLSAMAVENPGWGRVRR